MSAGRSSEGAGCITWWGFSPARDLLRAGPVRPEGDVNVLLVGSGDPRHILKSISGLQKQESLHVWVIENSMEVVARQLLLLYLALMPKESMGNNEKTEVFLELFGNGEIRSQTEETLRHAASQLSLSVTETLESAAHPCLNTTLLKFKERDELAQIFKSWLHPRPSSPSPAAPIIMSKVWDYRVRQHLGTRYDARKGCFDWDLTMKLHQNGCGVINKQQYVRWRERGLAFEMREGIYQITNPSLLSSRVFQQRGGKVAVRGYWGDIASSPYIAFGVETDDKSLLKTHNGQHIKTAQDISFANVQELFQSVSSRRGCFTASQSDAETEEPTAEPDQKSVTINDLICMDGISVTFLPVDSLHKLPEKQRYSHFFNTIYFSASCVHQLGPTMRQIAAPDAVLVVELAKYIVDLNKEQITGFAEKVASVALEAEFEPWRDGRNDDVHAVFIPRRK